MSVHAGAGAGAQAREAGAAQAKPTSWARSDLSHDHGLGNNRPLPSLARPRLLHRLDRKHSKIFVHPLGMRHDVCNDHTRS